MEDITRIVSPGSASWVVWVLLLLICIAVSNISVLFSLPTLWRSLSSYSNRIYTGGGTQTLLNRALSVVFRVGVLSMCAYMLCNNGTSFVLLKYCMLIGVVGAVALIQWLAWQFVGYTFLQPAQRENTSEHRSVIYNATCVILLMLLLPMIHTTTEVYHYVAVAIFLVVLFGVMLVRAIQMFCQSPLKLLYILLYIITLEFLPLAGIIVWAKQII